MSFDARGLLTSSSTTIKNALVFYSSRTRPVRDLPSQKQRSLEKRETRANRVSRKRWGKVKYPPTLPLTFANPFCLFSTSSGSPYPSIRGRERERERACSLLNRGPRLFLVGTERLATCRVPRLNNASVTWSIRPASSVVNHLEEERVLLLVDDATVDSPHPPEPPVSLVITAINPRGEISCLSTDFLMVVVACER